MSDLKYDIPSISEIETKSEAHFGYKPCSFQIKASLAQLQKYKTKFTDRQAVICLAGTGSGKTLAFYIPFLFNDGGISIMVTPLNVLAEQMAVFSRALGITVANLTGETIIPEEKYKEIEEGNHRLIIISPEAIQSKPRLRKVFKSTKLASRLFSIIFDEAHCISQWRESFRPQYGHVVDLGDLVPSQTIFYITSATMPNLVLKDVLSKLRLDRTPEQISTVRISNDRANIYLDVWKMEHSISSFLDLQFLIPDELDLEKEQPEKFMVFFDSKIDAQNAVDFLQSRIPKKHIDKILWFHSGMSEQFRTETIREFKAGKVWGLCCTDAAGMGLDLPDVKITVQWKAPKSLCTLVQRLGRAVRNKALRGHGILIAEPKYFENEKVIKKTVASEEADAITTTSKVTNTIPTASKAKTAKPAANKEKGKSKSAKRKSDCLEDNFIEKAVLNYINTASHMCRRVIINSYFGNDVLTQVDHCCDRCSAPRLSMCCDLCSVRGNDLPDVSDGEQLPKIKRVSNIPMTSMIAVRKISVKYIPDSTDLKLLSELSDWRQRQYESLFTGDIFFGPCMVMSDAIMQCIVDVAHAGRIATVQDLIDQTGWTGSLAKRHGLKIIEIIVNIRPVQTGSEQIHSYASGDSCPLTKTTRHNFIGNTVNATANVPPVKVYRCSACGNVGHTVRNKKCPKYTKPLPQNNLTTPNETIDQNVSPTASVPSGSTITGPPGPNNVHGLPLVPTYLGSMYEPAPPPSITYVPYSQLLSTPINYNLFYSSSK